MYSAWLVTIWHFYPKDYSMDFYIFLKDTSFSLMRENCLVQHAASLFRGLISVLNEQAARSTSLTEKLVSKKGNLVKVKFFVDSTATV
jgi:hypothetical protein